MDRQWKIRTIIGLVLTVISLICVITSSFQEDNNTLLNIGLVCICIDLVFFMSTMFVRRK